MQGKLILSLWIIGGLLYAGSTVFLANTLLGGSSGNKEKSITLAAAGEAQCEQDSIASAEADETQTAAVEPKTPAPAKPAEAASKPETEHGVQPDAAEQGQDPNQDWQPADETSDTASQDVPGMPGDGPEEGPWYQDQAGAQPDGPMEAEEWAHVVAGTANMRSEPDLRSPLIYALPSGWQVRVISRSPGWVQVQDANSGAAGWVEATAIGPGAGPQGPAAGYGRHPRGPYGPGSYPQYADEGYPPPPWERRRERRGDFGAFLGRVFGGF
jgi:hypothetical protein